jgi:hypothetical protein
MRTDRKISVNITNIKLYGSSIIRPQSCFLRTETDGRSEFNRRYARLQLRQLFHLLLSRLVKQKPAPLLKIDSDLHCVDFLHLYDVSSYRFEDVSIFRHNNFRPGFLFHVFLLNMSAWHMHSFTSNAPRNVTSIKHLNNLVRPVLKPVLHKFLKHHNSVLMNSYYFLIF